MLGPFTATGIISVAPPLVAPLAVCRTPRITTSPKVSEGFIAEFDLKFPIWCRSMAREEIFVATHIGLTRKVTSKE